MWGNPQTIFLFVSFTHADVTRAGTDWVVAMGTGTCGRKGAGLQRALTVRPRQSNVKMLRNRTGDHCPFPSVPEHLLQEEEAVPLSKWLIYSPFVSFTQIMVWL